LIIKKNRTIKIKEVDVISYIFKDIFIAFNVDVFFLEDPNNQ